MASNQKPKDDEEAKKNKKKKTKSKQLQTASASKSPNKKTPTKPNQEKKKKKNTKANSNDNSKKVRNGKVSEPKVLIIPSSSGDSQEVEECGGGEEEQGDESKNRNAKKSKPQKRNKRKETEEDENEEEGEDGTMCRFPMARIKRIIKSEDSTLQLGQDVVFLVNKATEKFLEQFCEEGHECSVRDRKKSLGYKQLSSVVSKQRRFDFLSDFVPEKLKAEDALAERRLTETG